MVSLAMPRSSITLRMVPIVASCSIMPSLYSVRVVSPGWSRCSAPHMRTQVHSGRVEPAKERRIGLHLASYEIDGGGRCFVVDRLHPFLGERAGVLDGLPPDPAPTRLIGGIVAIRRLAAQDSARTEFSRNAGSRG